MKTKIKLPHNLSDNCATTTTAAAATIINSLALWSTNNETVVIVAPIVVTGRETLGKTFRMYKLFNIISGCEDRITNLHSHGSNASDGDLSHHYITQSEKHRIHKYPWRCVCLSVIHLYAIQIGKPLLNIVLCQL